MELKRKAYELMGCIADRSSTGMLQAAESCLLEDRVLKLFTLSDTGPAEQASCRLGALQAAMRAVQAQEEARLAPVSPPRPTTPVPHAEAKVPQAEDKSPAPAAKVSGRSPRERGQTRRRVRTVQSSSDSESPAVTNNSFGFVP